MLKDKVPGMLVLAAAVVIVPFLILIAVVGAAISAVIVLLVSPLIGIASLWLGEGDNFGQRFIFNVIVLFGLILEGLGQAF
jgi:hypothetical protein